MRKRTLLFISTLLCITLNATTKTVNVINAGTLHNSFSPADYSTVTDLTISGNIDARDFKFMRDTLTVLAKINLSAANIAAYSGTGGTSPFTSDTYFENYIPIKAFGFLNPSTRITNIVLPNSITSISSYAFWNCNGLTSMTIPEKVNSFSGLFTSCEGIREIHFKNPVPVPYDPIIYMENLHARLGLEYQESNNITVAIYVPEDAVNAYTASPDLGGWDYVNNQYIQIIGESATNINDQQQHELNIAVKEGMLRTSNLPLGETLVIYNIQGTKLYSAKITSDSQDINLPARGMYIVKIGAVSVKVLY